MVELDRKTMTISGVLPRAVSYSLTPPFSEGATGTYTGTDTDVLILALRAKEEGYRFERGGPMSDEVEQIFRKAEIEIKS